MASLQTLISGLSEPKAQLLGSKPRWGHRTAIMGRLVTRHQTGLQHEQLVLESCVFSWFLLHLSVSCRIALWPAACDGNNRRNSHRLLGLSGFSPSVYVSGNFLRLFPQSLLPTWLRLALTLRFTACSLNPWCLHLFSDRTDSPKGYNGFYQKCQCPYSPLSSESATHLQCIIPKSLGLCSHLRTVLSNNLSWQTLVVLNSY